MSVKVDSLTKKLALGNLGLGLFLWLLLFSDYSFVGVVADLVFPFIVGYVALISLSIIKKRTDQPLPKWIKWAHLPSLITGGLYVIFLVLSMVPPFTLGTLFVIDEIRHEVKIQQLVSPDGTQVAHVYFRPVGAYTGGSGKVYMKLRNPVLPFFEKSIFSSTTRTTHEDTEDYVEWLNDDVLYVSEFRQTLLVGGLHRRMRYVVFLLIVISIKLIYDNFFRRGGFLNPPL